MIDVLVDMSSLSTPSRRRGIGRYVASLCGALAARRPAAGDPAIVGLVRHRGRVQGALDPTLRFTGDPAIEMSSADYSRYKLERRLFLGSLAHRARARLLHLPDPYGTPLDGRVPRIVTCHDLIPLLLHRDYLAPVPGARAVQWLRDLARYRAPHRVIAISASTRRDLVEHVGVAPERIDVVYHGVDHRRFTAVAEADEGARVTGLLGFEGPCFLYLGADDPRKNLQMLLRAHARSGIAAEVPLVLAGQMSPRRRREVEATIRRLGSGRDVRLLGYVEERLVPPLYRRCLAHVFPSAYEGFGLPVLEGMACGAPTICGQVSSLGEVAGDAALVLEALEADALAQALHRVAEDAELRAGLRRRGIARARAFTWQRSAEQTVQCYTRALEELR